MLCLLFVFFWLIIWGKSITAGTTWWQECEAAAFTSLTIRKKIEYIGSGAGLQSLKPLLGSERFHNLPNSATIWGPIVQTYEPVRNFSCSNNNR